MSEKRENGEQQPTESENGELSLAAELEKARKDHLYLLADFDNYRKNSIKERSELVKFGCERFIREFLDVYDNFERALATDLKSENLDSFKNGVKLIAEEIETLLQKFGVSECSAEGQAFDPSMHEALSSEPRADLTPGHVARVLRPGFKLHDKLLRPAQVTVAIAPAETSGSKKDE